VGPITLSIRTGEATGLVGRMGSGIHDIAFLLQGLERPWSGEVRLTEGVRRACVAPFRETQGVFPDMAVGWNMTISALKRWRRTKVSLDIRSEQDAASAMGRRMGIISTGLHAPIRELSGGNQQKALFGRALLMDPQVYVLCEPTRGIDVATRRNLYDVVEGLRRSGAGIVVASSDPEDVATLCDRIYLVEDGQIVRELDAEETTVVGISGSM
jgi:ribose transport system ATP-binding protein